MTQAERKDPNRLGGLDLARGLAVIGMVFVNFMYVLSHDHLALIEADETAISALSGVDILTGGIVLVGLAGRAAAVFLTLFGIGLMLQVRKNGNALQAATAVPLLKRYLLLVGGGLAFTLFWEADILHYIGLFGLIALPLTRLRRRGFVIILAGVLIGGEILRRIFEYRTGWGAGAIGTTYLDLWSPLGYLRQMLFNGYHPLFPWLAFVIYGMFLGRNDLRSPGFHRNLITVGVVAASIGFILNACGTPARFFPADTLFILLGMANATWVIGLSLYLAERFGNSRLLTSLRNLGRLALTQYLAHVILGIGVVMLVRGETADIPFAGSFLIALAYLLVTILLGDLWLRKRRQGPLEALLRSATRIRR
ncbi:MAG: DUF418 domain-containing protein [bacterium]|nr:DUF418 domain-containing protein [bacterium]